MLIVGRPRILFLFNQITGRKQQVRRHLCQQQAQYYVVHCPQQQTQHHQADEPQLQLQLRSQTVACTGSTKQGRAWNLKFIENGNLNILL